MGNKVVKHLNRLEIQEINRMVTQHGVEALVEWEIRRKSPTDWAQSALKRIGDSGVIHSELEIEIARDLIDNFRADSSGRLTLEGAPDPGCSFLAGDPSSSPPSELLTVLSELASSAYTIAESASTIATAVDSLLLRLGGRCGCGCDKE